MLRAETKERWVKLPLRMLTWEVKGKTSDGEMEFKGVTQEARQMDDFVRRFFINDRDLYQKK